MLGWRFTDDGFIAALKIKRRYKGRSYNGLSLQLGLIYKAHWSPSKFGTAYDFDLFRNIIIYLFEIFFTTVYLHHFLFSYLCPLSNQFCTHFINFSSLQFNARIHFNYLSFANIFFFFFHLAYTSLEFFNLHLIFLQFSLYKLHSYFDYIFKILKSFTTSNPISTPNFNI